MSSYTDSTRLAAEVARYVQRQFGDESGVQITNDDIIRWTNAGQQEIFLRNEPLKATAYADIVAGQKDYTLPTDILRIQSILVNGLPVEQKSTQEIEEYILHEDPQYIGQGQPVVWAEWGGTVTFYPTPDRDSTNGMTLKYVKGSTAVVSINDTLSTPDAYFNRLCEYVMQQAYELDENFDASKMKEVQFATGLGQQFSKDQVTPNLYPTITVLEEDL